MQSSTVEEVPLLHRSEPTVSAATQVLEAATRSIPKLKEQNYAQWKSVITHSIKTAKLWGYIDGSIKEPPEENINELIKYMNEAGAVRSAILRSLEPGAQRHVEQALGPRDAWIELEKRYLTAGNDTQLLTVEQQLADLKLEEGGDVVEHIANFCRLGRHLSESRFALDEQSSIDMMYRSLPPSYRRSILTPEGAEMKDFSVLCARLRQHHQTPIADLSSALDKDHACWGVPEDIKAFGLTGDKNPLLKERASITCQDCLLKDHEAGTPNCPQYEWRRELWGTVANKDSHRAGDPAYCSSSEGPVAINTKRLSYEFSEPVKVVLGFDDLGLQGTLRDKLRSCYSIPSAIQQCAILPIIKGRNVLAQAPRKNGKTTTLAISILQMINTSQAVQALVFAPTEQAADLVHQTLEKMKGNSGACCYLCNPSRAVAEAELGKLIEGSHYHIVVGTPKHLLGLILRNILKTYHVKILALDDIDKLLEIGSEEQILEIYRHTPPLAQVIASCTVPPSTTPAVFSQLLLDPVRIRVNRDEGIFMRAPHFFVKIPEDQKPNVLLASFASLAVQKLFVFCHDIDKIAGNSWSNGYYYMREPMNMRECKEVMEQFKRHSGYRGVSRTALVTTSEVLPTAGLVSLNIPLINYDVPNNVDDYIKRINNWRDANPEYCNMIITFVASDTNGMQVLGDFERYFGVQVGELLWDGKKIY